MIVFIIFVVVTILWTLPFYMLYRSKKYGQVATMIQNHPYDYSSQPEYLWYVKQEMRPSWRKKLVP